MKGDFQIIHSFKPKALKEELLSLLKKTIDESTTIQINIEERPKEIKDWSIFDWIEIKYNYPSGNKYIAGFSLVREFDVEESDANIKESKDVEESKKLAEEFKRLADEFGQKLQSNSDIDLIIKYNDEGMQTEHQKHAKEIFELEMELREVISFVFMDIYRDDYFSLLSFQEVKGKGIKESEKENTFKKGFQNEFFFLNFNQYGELKIPDIVKVSTLNKLFGENTSGSNLKSRILNLGIFKHNDKYKALLGSIKECMQPIEEVRNCIAHNRPLTFDAETNYYDARIKLEKLINNFWNDIQNEKTEET